MTTDIVMGEAFDLAVRELDQLIDRRFAARRTLTVERESEKHWVAELSGRVLYRSPDYDATMRFALTFVERTPGVTLGGVGTSSEWSVRVPTLRVVQ
jgi:hypothetical protein